MVPPPPHPKGPPVAPHPGPPCSTCLGSWERGGCVALPPARDVAGSLDLRNPVALQGVEQLHVRVSHYTLTLRPSGKCTGECPTEGARKSGCERGCFCWRSRVILWTLQSMGSTPPGGPPRHCPAHSLGHPHYLFELDHLNLSTPEI